MKWMCFMESYQTLMTLIPLLERARDKSDILFSYFLLLFIFI